MMKRLLILLTLLPVLAFESDEPVSKLNGAYQMSKLKYGAAKDWAIADDRVNIKVFKEGYWFAGSLKKGNTELNGVCGGTYDLKNGKYNEHIDFYSWDSTAVGTSISMDYKVDTKAFQQIGKMNSAKYPNYDINEVRDRIVASEPLKSADLEGVWFMKEGYWGGSHRFGDGKYKDVTVMKIFAYPIVVFAYYDPIKKKFDGGGASEYQFDGKQLTEKKLLWTWDMTTRGQTKVYNASVDNSQFVQTGEESKFREVWVKAPGKN